MSSIGMALRSHLINIGRWRGQRFEPATRREEGASPQWGCDRRTTTWQAQRSVAPILFSLLSSFILPRLSLIQTPLRVFMRWLRCFEPRFSQGVWSMVLLLQAGLRLRRLAA